MVHYTNSYRGVRVLRSLVRGESILREVVDRDMLFNKSFNVRLWGLLKQLNCSGNVYLSILYGSDVYQSKSHPVYLQCKCVEIDIESKTKGPPRVYDVHVDRAFFIVYPSIFVMNI